VLALALQRPGLGKVQLSNEDAHIARAHGDILTERGPGKRMPSA
jgi:hypothetical protein